MTEYIFYFTIDITASKFFRDIFLKFEDQKKITIVILGAQTDLEFRKWVDINEISIRYLNQDVRYGFNLYKIFQCFIAVYLDIKRNFKSKNYRIITNTPKISFIIAVLSIFVSLNDLYHICHGLPSTGSKGFKKKLIFLFEKTVLKLSTKNIYVSSSLMNYAFENSLDCNYNSTYINGIKGVKSVLKTKSSNEKYLRVGFIGRITSDKGIYDFVSVAKYFDSSMSLNFPIQFYAAGPLSDNSFNFIQSLPYITFYPGWIDPNKFYENIDVLLFPSKREGFGMVLMEAASFGIPAIAYDIVGVKDAVISDVTGYLVQPFNISELIEALKIYLENHDKLIKHSINAHNNAVINFSNDSISLQWVSELFK